MIYTADENCGVDGGGGLWKTKPKHQSNQVFFCQLKQVCSLAENSTKLWEGSQRMFYSQPKSQTVPLI